MTAVRLEARALTLTVAGRTLCHGLSATLAAGENRVILGANGSGKTMLLLMLAGLRAPDSGEVLLDRRPVRSYAARERARRIGVLFQDPETVFPAIVLETVLTGRHPHLERWRWERPEDAALA